MAAIEPGAPARPTVAPRQRRATRAKATFPYLNRELSWLEFNARVLHEARDERNPLLERVKFLAIFAGNLDEFFQVRIAGLRQQVEAGKVARSPDGRTADEQLAAARARVLDLVADHSQIFVVGPPRAGRRGRRAARLRGHPRASRGAPPAVPRRDLPGPDAARGRPRAPVPVHLDAVAVDRGRPARPGDRRARLRPGQGAADPAAPARGRAVALRAHRPGHRGQPRHALLGDGGRGAPPLPGHPQRRLRDRGGRGGRPPARHRGGAPAPPVRGRRPARGRAVDARRDAGAAAARARPRRGRLLRRQRHARPDRAVVDRRPRPARPQARALVAGHAAAAHPARRGRAGRRVRRDPRRRHPRPPPVRVVRRVRRSGSSPRPPTTPRS